MAAFNDFPLPDVILTLKHNTITGRGRRGEGENHFRFSIFDFRFSMLISFLNLWAQFNPMPKIYDNIENVLLDGLELTIKSSFRSDFCVGINIMYRMGMGIGSGAEIMDD